MQKIVINGYEFGQGDITTSSGTFDPATGMYVVDPTPAIATPTPTAPTANATPAPQNSTASQPLTTTQPTTGTGRRVIRTPGTKGTPRTTSAPTTTTSPAPQPVQATPAPATVQTSLAPIAPTANAMPAPQNTTPPQPAPYSPNNTIGLDSLTIPEKRPSKILPWAARIAIAAGALYGSYRLGAWGYDKIQPTIQSWWQKDSDPKKDPATTPIVKRINPVTVTNVTTTNNPATKTGESSSTNRTFNATPSNVENKDETVRMPIPPDGKPVFVGADSPSGLNAAQQELQRLIQNESNESFSGQPVMVVYRDALPAGTKYAQVVEKANLIYVNGYDPDKSILGINNKELIGIGLSLSDTAQREYTDHQSGESGTIESRSYFKDYTFSNLRVVWLENIASPLGLEPYGMFTVYHEYGHCLASLHGIKLDDYQTEPHAETYAVLRHLQKTYQADPDNFDAAVAYCHQYAWQSSYGEWVLASATSATERNYYTTPVHRALLKNDAALARQIVRDNENATPAQLAQISANLVQQYLPPKDQIESATAAVMALHPAVNNHTWQKTSFYPVIEYFTDVLNGKTEPATPLLPEQKSYMQNFIGTYDDHLTAQKYYILSLPAQSR